MTLGEEQPSDDLRTQDFDYTLPQQLIAQTPLARREKSRLLVLDKSTGEIAHSTFVALGDWLTPGDLLVANNSRVIPARLFGRRLPGGGRVELLLLRHGPAGWSALARPASRLKPGMNLEIAPLTPGATTPAIATVIAIRGGGEVLLQLDQALTSNLGAYGHVPLPPYISEPLADAERYQTVYSRALGSAAAPTAGLHFTLPLINSLVERGIAWCEVTLHVGLDTFRPVEHEHVAAHHIHQEWCHVDQETAEVVAAHRRAGGRIVAVGTTAARTLETLGRNWSDDHPRGFSGYTDEFILPGHRWRLVDALITNFHLPRSTLLMLVSALAGRDAILRAYAEAIRSEYRFYSFGDAMLIR